MTSIYLALAGCVSEALDPSPTLDIEDDKADGAGGPAGAPIAMTHAVDVEAYDGSPFLFVMLDKGGIKAQLDDDYATTYEVAPWSRVRLGVQSFDGKVVRKVARSFSTTTGMHDLVTSLEASSFTPASIAGVVIDASPRPSDVFTVGEVLAMSSGAGTLVKLDGHNYFYNYGYKSGADDNDLKSGRSFGASPGHKANDASDTFYLGELGKLLTSTNDPTSFYQALFDILTRSHVAGLASLSPLAQTVATDFVAIYTAESDRHIMAHLIAHPWENDLAEVTMVSIWGTAVGKVMKDGHIVDGVPKDYWAMSPTTQRSGIGETRADRRRLQRLITSYERTAHPELVANLQTITGASTDAFRGVMEYLNDARFLGDQDALRTIPGEQLTAATVAFLAQVRIDAADMLATPAFGKLTVVVESPIDPPE
jgi:hypothetical protein